MGTKVVNVVDGNYKIVTKSNGEIWLDTGVLQGTVYITGNLDVKGTTTTVESTVVTIKDNVIILNQGETGNGISPTVGGQSGISIDRGNYADVRILFDENVSHYNGVTNPSGTFTFTDDTGALKGIQTTSIRTSGNNNLYLLSNSSNGWVTVAQTNNYERHVLDYTNYDLATGPIVLTSDPNAIPNTQALYDYVDSAFTYFFQNHIGEGDTTVYTYDDSEGNAPSRIEFKVDNSQRVQINNGGLDVDNINLFTNTINNTTNNLILTASTTNTVEVDGVLQLDDTTGPTAVSGSTKIYTLDSSNPGPGKTGVYFTSLGSSDELVAKNRALLFSILF